MSPSPGGTTEVMSSIVSVVQRLSRPYRTQFCFRARNPAINRWAILIQSLRDWMGRDSCPWSSGLHLKANTDELCRVGIAHQLMSNCAVVDEMVGRAHPMGFLAKVFGRRF